MYRRTLGDPIPMGTKFRRTGVPTHQHRLIVLDVAVRSHISDPQIERFEDDSVRYNIMPRRALVMEVLWNHQDLKGYVLVSTDGWATLFSPICGNCLRSYREHIDNKCLFEATAWAELNVPPLRSTYAIPGETDE